MRRGRRLPGPPGESAGCSLCSWSLILIAAGPAAESGAVGWTFSPNFLSEWRESLFCAIDVGVAGYARGHG